MRWFGGAFRKAAADRMAGEHVKLGRVAAPGDVADVVLFPAGRESRHVTGQLVPVDGGLHVNFGMAGIR